MKRAELGLRAERSPEHMIGLACLPKHMTGSGPHKLNEVQQWYEANIIDASICCSAFCISGESVYLMG